MFLYRQISKHSDAVVLTEDYDFAVTKARQFVGEHNAVDGCSSEPHESTMPSGCFRIHRTTSFGIRRAYVMPIQMEELTQL